METRTEPLFIPPALEPVTFGSRLSDQRHTLYQYLHNIGETQCFEEVAPHLLDRPTADYKRSGFDAKARHEIKVIRDQGLDLAPFPHLTDKDRQLHHIYAVGFLHAFLNLDQFPDLVNHPNNGITLSKMSHVGPYIPQVNHPRHPDVHIAQVLYKHDPESYSRVFAQHIALALDGVKYWIFGDDQKMFEIARARTEKMRAANQRR